jgi:hypothetical protein
LLSLQQSKNIGLAPVTEGCELDIQFDGLWYFVALPPTLRFAPAGASKIGQL